MVGCSTFARLEAFYMFLGKPLGHFTYLASLLKLILCHQCFFCHDLPSQEVDCEYSFVWPTLLACPHKELECVARGGRYDLRPLLHYHNYMVTTSGDYTIAVGGCR